MFLGSMHSCYIGSSKVKSAGGRPPFLQILSKLSEIFFDERSYKLSVLFYLITAFGNICFLTTAGITNKKGTKCDLPDETLEGASTTSKREAMIFQASKVDFIVLFFV